jgi:hypothetical protein
MFDLMIVHEALKNSWTPDVPAEKQDSLISLLIHDIFGAEILKTKRRRGWHYYNRIEGQRIDLARPEINNSVKANKFEDNPATPDETYRYFEQEEYSSFLFRFINAFEEAVGLQKGTGQESLNCFV